MLLHCYSWYLYCTQLADVVSHSSYQAATFRHVLITADSKHRKSVISDQEKVCHVKLQSTFWAFYRHVVQFSLRPEGKQSHSLIQTRLKAQGNLRLVTTNVRLNSSSHYLWGERERVRPKTIQKGATQRGTHTKSNTKKTTQGSERAGRFQPPCISFKKFAPLLVWWTVSSVSAETFPLMTLSSSDICWLCG